MLNFDRKGNNIKQTIFIITGKVGSGKTTFLEKLIKSLQERGLTVAGIIATRSGNKEPGQSYELRIAGSKESFPLSSREYVIGWNKIGNFYFNPEVLKQGNEVLNDPQILNNDLIVIDEIGIFELEGKIWADAISRLIKKTDKSMIWVVRDSLVEKVKQRCDLKDPVIIDIENVSIKDAEKMIMSRF